MSESDNNLQQAALAGTTLVKAVLLLAIAWFMAASALIGLILMAGPAGGWFYVLVLISALSDLVSIVVGARLIRETLCRGAGGLWQLPTGDAWFRIQVMWLLLSGVAFAVALMAW